MASEDLVILYSEVEVALVNLFVTFTFQIERPAVRVLSLTSCSFMINVKLILTSYIVAFVNNKRARDGWSHDYYFYEREASWSMRKSKLFSLQAGKKVNFH